MTYADVLKELETKPSPDEVESKAGKIRKTRGRNLLIELRKDPKLVDVSREAEGDEIFERPMVLTVTIGLRDLKETTTEEEIREAFTAALVEATLDQVEGKAIHAGPRAIKAALVVAPRAKVTVKELKPGKIRVGWVMQQHAKRS